MNLKTPAIEEALRFMKKYEKEPQHVLHVTTWAQLLFQELRADHHLKSREFELLTIASLLHDTGWLTATQDRPHHKESARLIRQLDWKNLSRKDRTFVALLARYHRKSPPSSQHHKFQNLPRDKKQTLCLLAGILRVADAMDRSHRQKLQPVGLQLRPGICLLLARGLGHEEASYGLERKGDLFQKTFQRQPILKIIPS